MWYGVVLCGVVESGGIWCGVVWSGVVLCGVVESCLVWQDEVLWNGECIG